MKTPGARYLLFFSIILILGSGTPLFSQVDTEELSTSQEPINFINYEGPQDRIETRAQIRNIGFTAGQAIRAGDSTTGTSARYFVIHSVSDPEGDKLDADILGLGPDAGVDHIRNLRLIIQGYLEGAYDYSERDAALLAQYITIYNAVFRGNWDFFTRRYKTPVIGNLTREKAGLSTRYDEWPGRSLIVIPLQTAMPGSLSAIDTSTLTENDVIGELRQDDDKGIPQRQGMVDIKEREAEQAEQAAAAKREAIANDEKVVAEDRQQNQQERQQIAEDRQQLKEDQEAGKISPEEAEAAEKELDTREAEADQKDEEIAQKEEELDEQRQEAEKTEEFAEQKAAEAQQERQDIAQDQQGLINQQAAQAPQGVLGIKLESPNSALGRIVKLQIDSGTTLQSSALNSINARTFTLMEGKILAVAGEDRGNGAIRLVEISPATLEMIKQGEDDIHPQSLLWINGQDIYAISSAPGGLYLGRYNTELARQARSTVTVHPFATVTFQDDLIITQNTEGQAVLLNAKDLTERK
ncbi:conserved hypothetical protein [Treponema primitia ZAS-2]|uniref:P83100 family protein n=1 Tax=Treponema primitia (strain ATCC BAA-887 / DSM 12427 / ZAS-2) TaxID=545694 RepID=F5YGZ1_TREPZ|nr:P83/100 family protein [Treponema primitia]AEF85390.1 conserved hypothetical protein [Treponema primitia ZAS-2]